MKSLEAIHSMDLYEPWLSKLVLGGTAETSRGREYKELLDCVSIVKEPWHHCILIPSRQWNPWLAMSEALWILSGREDIAALSPYNSAIKEYSDDGVTLYGAYGKRIFDQIDDVIGRLQKDPGDRRAVLQIWDSSDLTKDTKDPPCNNLVYFKLRDSKLHMTVICRSNDLHYGLFAVNLPTFGILQNYIAARLKVDMGTQTHLSNSLHIYTDNKRVERITERMLDEKSSTLPVYPAHQRVFVYDDFTNIKNHTEFAKMCSSVLDQENLSRSGRVPLFLSFASLYLAHYRAKTPLSDHYMFPEFGDWDLAARIFEERVWGSTRPTSA